MFLCTRWDVHVLMFTITLVPQIFHKNASSRRWRFCHLVLLYHIYCFSCSFIFFFSGISRSMATDFFSIRYFNLFFNRFYCSFCIDCSILWSSIHNVNNFSFFFLIDFMEYLMVVIPIFFFNLTHSWLHYNWEHLVTFAKKKHTQ
jgi:hypothetical protein